MAATSTASEHFINPESIEAAQTSRYRTEHDSLSKPELRGRHDRVLHPVWGVGQVLNTTSTASTAMVQFRDCVRDVPRATLRRVLPIRTLAALVEQVSQVTAWTIRKAHDEGTIEPDAVGRFAGHRVHYYDTARIPALIVQLSRPDKWSIGTLVTHVRYGAGVISASCAPESSDNRYRLVSFFSSCCNVSALTEDLHALIPRHTVAQRLGIDSRSFRKRAAELGIYPDYIAPQGRVREYYDESRLEAISKRWNKSLRGDSFCPGSFVLNVECGVGRIASRNARGQVRIQSVQSRFLTESSEVTNLQELISLRELARRLNISRYKLQRLLAAVKIQPLHQHGKTQYFDAVRTERAVVRRLDSEREAITLPVLAARIGVSERLLGQKVREGCIRALGHHSLHLIASGEADRVQRVVTALLSRSDGIESLGVCRLHRRGRTGLEVAAWNIDALVQAAQGLSPDRQTVLFSQVAWMSEGVSRKRLRAAFDEYLGSIQATGDRTAIQRTAKCLLKLTWSLTTEFSKYRVRLLLLSSGLIQEYYAMEQRIRMLATECGCDDTRAHNRFRSQLHEQLAEVVERENDLLASAIPKSVNDRIRGAVLIAVSDRKPEVGVVTEIEQQCWNPLLRCWHKTLAVRFADGDRRTTVALRDALHELPQRAEPPVVLLWNSDALRIAQLAQQGCPPDWSCDEFAQQATLLKKVS